jgi:hypothetical protein
VEIGVKIIFIILQAFAIVEFGCELVGAKC